MAARRSASKRRTASGGSCTPAMPPAARSAGRCGSASSRCGPVETINHALVTELIVDGGQARGVRFFDHGRPPLRGARRRHAAGDGRRGTGLSRDDEPRGGDGRRRCARVPRRRARGRSRVRAVSSDGAEPGGGAPVPRSPRRCAARARAWSTPGDEPFMTRYHHARRPCAARRRGPQHRARDRSATAGAVFLTLAHLDRRARPAAVPDDRRDVPAGRPRPRRRSRFRSVRPRTT